MVSWNHLGSLPSLGFKKVSGTVAGTARRVLRTTVPDTFLNHGMARSVRPLCSSAAALILALWSGVAGAQETAQYFRQNCSSCHTIGGGRLTGPDLKDVTARQNRDWLVRFIQDPQRVIESGDGYAAKLKEEARGVIMPIAPGMTKNKAEALLDLIEAESKLEKSEFAGLLVSTEPFTPDDVEHGREYFQGVRSLKNGGAACISCHCVRGTGALGGGRLGPDLSRVYERLEGRRNLSAWLFAPATTTMQPVFRARPLTPEEIHALVAFFEDSARRGGEADMSGPLAFLMIGLGCSLAGLVALDSIWRERFRGVRRLLIRRSVVQKGVRHRCAQHPLGRPGNGA